MTRRISGLEQAALLLLKNAQTYHPLVTAMVARVVDDLEFTGPLPTYGDLTDEEWRPWAFGGRHLELGDLLDEIKRQSARFGRRDLVGLTTLTYPLPHDYECEENELTREHWETMDRLTQQLASAVKLYRMGETDQLTGAIADYHRMVVQAETRHVQDWAAMKGG